MDKKKYLESPLEHKGWLLRFFSTKAKLIIFDIGACEGLDSIKYARLFPNSKVYAFEPLPNNFNQIPQNLEECKVENVEIYNLALSDKKGEESIYVSSGTPKGLENDDWNYGNKSSSLLKPKEVTQVHKWLSFSSSIRVNTNSVDNIIGELSTKHIDIIHLDVQGAELNVLKGAKDTLHNIKAIWLEVSQRELYENQAKESDIVAFLKQFGFEKIYNTENDELLINTNYFPLVGKTLSANHKSGLIRKIRNRIGYQPYQHLVKKSYSQSGEDLIVKYIFDVIGIEKITYIDIGAHHPYYLNNTNIFYETGSRGINIEPNPSLYQVFEKERPFDINLNVGIHSGENKTLDYYEMSNPTLNTFSKEEANEYKNQEDIEILKVSKIEVKSLVEVTKQYNNGNFTDFISIDVEGLDEEIIKSIDFDTMQPNVISIETISYSNRGRGINNLELIEYIKQKGYLLYANTNINSIFVKKDFWYR